MFLQEDSIIYYTTFLKENILNLKSSFSLFSSGKVLVFSDNTGVNRLGEIVLSSEDVPTTWVTVSIFTCYLEFSIEYV